MKNIIQTLEDRGNFTKFVEALEKANLADSFKANGPLTVFAPDDDAFKDLPAGTIKHLLEQDIEQLKRILRYHVLDGAYSSDMLHDLPTIESVGGENVTLDRFEGDIIVNDAEVTEANIECTNGIIHVIDMVLIPKMD
jgi:uncharacterized surface protein with fasciclin (FAS1) repeats